MTAEERHAKALGSWREKYRQRQIGTASRIKLKAYFSQSLLSNEDDKLWALKSKALAKWWLDLMRNVVVVAVLQYFARMSDNLAVKIIADGLFFALCAYCTSYLSWWSFHPFFFLNNKRAEFWASMIVGLALTMALWFSIFGGIGLAIREIARLQKPGEASQSNVPQAQRPKPGLSEPEKPEMFYTRLPSAGC